METGNYVIICTGRPRYHTETIMKEAGASPIIVSNNGAEIFNTNTNKIISSSLVDIEECYKLIDYAIIHDLRLVVSIGSSEYVTKDLKNDNQILLDFNNYKEQLKDKNIYQCMFVDSKLDEIKKLRRLIKDSETISIKNRVHQNKVFNSTWFTVGNIKATKGTALVKLANYFNVPIENTIAIGNDYNDIPMFQQAGFSICVNNAIEEVKRYTDYITLSNDEDGVAIVLEKILIDEI